jgi:predicted NUDIX family NTP pyrophosphohydrolase
VKRSAGTLLYRTPGSVVEVMLVHMGGPFWARKDEHAWSIPKGEHSDTEDPHEVAAREFAEELGSELPPGPELPLGSTTASGKRITVFARAADFDATTCVSNTFETEWPPRSGRMQSFPEVDRAEWFPIATARSKLVKGQLVFLDRLVDALAGPAGGAAHGAAAGVRPSARAAQAPPLDHAPGQDGGHR